MGQFIELNWAQVMLGVVAYAMGLLLVYRYENVPRIVEFAMWTVVLFLVVVLCSMAQ